MLSLTRPHRQVLATLALVGLSVVPTIYVAQLAWRVNRPGHVRDVEVEIGRRLNLRVTLEGVSYPRPGEVVYRGVVLHQPEPRNKGLSEIARAEVVRLERGDRELTLRAEGLRLRAEGPRLAMEQVGALLQQAGEAEWARVALTAPECRIELGDGPDGPLLYSCRDLAGAFESDRGRPRVTASYRLAEDDAATRCELALVRDRQEGAVRTAITLRTAEPVALPARVLDPFFSAADWLGPSARVAGELTLERVGGGDWGATFRGDLIDVDLAALVGRHWPHHRLSGTARVRIDEARWSDCWEARGELTAGPGTIGLALLRALKAEMNFAVPQLTGRRADIAFQGLGLRFDMARDGELKLEGALGTDFPPGAVLLDARRPVPLASAPPGAANVGGLIRTLVPIADGSGVVEVPFTREADLLSQSLPKPRLAAGSATHKGN